MTDGKVWLVGAGPGDAELITVKGKRLLEGADAVFYDELANPALLELAPAAAERFYVGKRASTHAVPQPEIVAWMVERARQGQQVVRLKGGDPFVFGRGGEEARQLTAAGVDWEVVPGISAGFAVPAAAGIPVTDRAAASSVHFYTGHLAGHVAGAEDGEPAGQAHGSATASLPVDGTLVVFMGVARIGAIADEAMRAGRAAGTPVAVIERGTHPEQRVVEGTLADIAGRAREAQIASPALIVIGDVVRLRRELLPEQPMRPERPGRRPGLILMAHGSSHASWHASVENLVKELAVNGQFAAAAYLEPAHPRLGEVVERAVEAGVTELAVVPYFLARGLHVKKDIPELIEAERERFPELKIELSACLEGHAALRAAVLARAGEALAALRAANACGR